MKHTPSYGLTLALFLFSHAAFAEPVAAQAGQAKGSSGETTGTSDAPKEDAATGHAATGVAATGEPGPSTSESTLALPAQDPKEDEARQAFQEGDRLYLEGDYQGAAAAFERAYALSGRVEMLFNLANAEERAGNYQEASFALRSYIPHAPVDQQPALERRLLRFESLATEKEEKEKRDAAARALSEKNAALARQQTGQVPLDKAVGVGLVALGGVGIVTGTVFAFSTLPIRSELDEVCDEGAQGRLCPASAEADLKRDRAYSLAADIALLSGAAVSGVGLYFLFRKTKSHEMRATLSPGRLNLQGTF